MNMIIASWAPGIDVSAEPPTSIRHENGGIVPIELYQEHSVGTHAWISAADGRSELHMFPGVITDVAYDCSLQRWVLDGPMELRIVLDLADPMLKDDQIIAELFTYPIVYRARIHHQNHRLV
jgi:hypothetical protein